MTRDRVVVAKEGVRMTYDYEYESQAIVARHYVAQERAMWSLPGGSFEHGGGFSQLHEECGLAHHDVVFGTHAHKHSIYRRHCHTFGWQPRAHLS